MPTRTVPQGSELHKKLLTMLSARVKLARAAHSKQIDKWSDAEDSMLAYVKETSSDALRQQRREAGTPQYTTIQIPYTYAQVMAAHTYTTSVFFARSPVHQFAGAHGEGEMQVQATEALIAYQVNRGRMMGPYYIWVYDGFKYGAGILGTYWDNQIVQYGQVVREEKIDEITGEGTGEFQLVQTSSQVQGYQGNVGYNVSPFDFMSDPRVPLGQFQRGEFCIIKKKISWNDLVRRQAQGYYMNVDKIVGTHAATGSGSSDSNSSLVRPDEGVDSREYVERGFGEGASHPAWVYLYEIYVDLLQNEWQLGDSKYPEKWVFTTTQDMSLLLGVEPLGAIHGQFPFDIFEPEVEAYAAYNRGIPSIMAPMQQTMDWLLNSHFFNVRASLNNQFVGDPSKLMMKDVKQSGEPGFFFRLRPEAYGTDVRTVLAQLPVSDVTRAHMSDLEQMFGIGEKVLGISSQMLGALTGQSRTSATEIRTSTGFGTNRLKTIAEYASHTAFGPHAEKFVQTSQQFYDQELKLRIVGDAATMAGGGFVRVTPDDIAGQYDFVHVDGTLPVDRLAQANLWKEILLSFRYMPQLLQMYDLSKIFAYTAQVAGLKNINQFRIEFSDPAQLARQAEAGNVVPMTKSGQGTGRSGGPNSRTEAGLSASLPSPRGR